MNKSESTTQAQESLNTAKKEKRRLAAIDETKIKLEKKQIFVWAAVDVDTKEYYMGF